MFSYLCAVERDHDELVAGVLLDHLPGDHRPGRVVGHVHLDRVDDAVGKALQGALDVVRRLVGPGREAVAVEVDGDGREPLLLSRGEGEGERLPREVERESAIPVQGRVARVEVPVPELGPREGCPRAVQADGLRIGLG